MEVSTFDHKVASELQVSPTWARAEKVNDRHEPHCKAEHWEEASQSIQTERRRLIEISNKLEDKKAHSESRKKVSSVGTLIPQVKSSERKSSFSQHEWLGVFKVLGLWGKNGYHQSSTKYIYIVLLFLLSVDLTCLSH